MSIPSTPCQCLLILLAWANAAGSLQSKLHVSQPPQLPPSTAPTTRGWGKGRRQWQEKPLNTPHATMLPSCSAYSLGQNGQWQSGRHGLLFLCLREGSSGFSSGPQQPTLTQQEKSHSTSSSMVTQCYHRARRLTNSDQIPIFQTTVLQSGGQTLRGVHNDPWAYGKKTVQKEIQFYLYSLPFSFYFVYLFSNMYKISRVI